MAKGDLDISIIPFIFGLMQATRKANFGFYYYFFFSKKPGLLYVKVK
jgi:hypothetical protein